MKVHGIRDKNPSRPIILATDAVSFFSKSLCLSDQHDWIFANQLSIRMSLVQNIK